MVSEEELAACIARARERHPDLDVPASEFAALLAEHAKLRPLAEVPVADLWLVVACVRGDIAAMCAFEQQALPAARGALARMGLRGDAADEVLQIVREKLFVAAPGERPKILDAVGRGELRGLVKVAAVRTALNLNRRDHRVDRADEQLVDALTAREDRPDLAALKSEQRAAFKQAIEDVLGNLDPRERNVLRMHLVHHLSIDEIGRTYDVHRATAARWLTSIRDRLQAETRALLRDRLKLEDRDLDSLFRLVESQLAVSFRRVLASLPDST